MPSHLVGPAPSIRFRNELLVLDKPQVMGILNTNPDSFFTQGQDFRLETLLKMAEKMVEEGARFLDIGGYSTRPGADFVSEKEEFDRVLPIFSKLKRMFPQIYLSIDTFRPEVAKAAIEEGADWINDVSGGLGNEKMWKVAADSKVPYSMMHIRNGVDTMHKPQIYSNVALEVASELSVRKEKAEAAGITDVVIDPGFGFSKNVDQNFELLKNLSLLNRLGVPLLVGLSRKSMIYKTLETTSSEALNGTTALNAIALSQGAHILRVHDVKPAVETIKLMQKLCLQE